MRKFLPLAAIAGLCLATAKADAAPWDKELWDPGEPVEHQLNLPLPCDGMMAFVRVETPTSTTGNLADREIVIGGAREESGYLDYFRTAHVRGSFHDGPRIFFYLAKYEVTQDQWAAVMAKDGDCPKPSRKGKLPQGGLGWFSAIDFTSRLTQFLRAHPDNPLPREDGMPGYIRLPTEVEWEYAARGGAKVDDADFRAALPPGMADQIEDYAWFFGQRSARGQYKWIGRKKPNPLGLYDTIGNVEELVLDPFHLNNLGRLHGQVGGFVSRGGSIQNPVESLRSSMRNEWAYFTFEDGKPTAFEFLGMRPMISAPVATSTARTSQTQSEWMAAIRKPATVSIDALAVLAGIVERQTDKRLQSELEVVRGRIIEERRVRQELTDRSTRLSLLNGTMVMRWLRQEQNAVDRMRAIVDIDERTIQSTQDPARKAQYQQRKVEDQAKLAAIENSFALASSAYLTSLIDLDETRGMEDIRQQAAQLILEVNERGQAALVPSINRFVENIGHRDQNPGLTRTQMVEDAVR
jgi:hypothetical protein